jgi:ketosteroid isomerase-like protein
VARTPDVTFEVERIVTEGDTVVVIGEWIYTGPTGRVRQPSVSVVDVRDGQIWRDLEYVGLAI